MKVMLTGTVVDAGRTKSGKAVRVIVADRSERNAVLILPPMEEGKLPKAGAEISVEVNPQVQMDREGKSTTGVVFMGSVGWPEWAKK